VTAKSSFPVSLLRLEVYFRYCFFQEIEKKFQFLEKDSMKNGTTSIENLLANNKLKYIAPMVDIRLVFFFSSLFFDFGV
jgi:hypothetical protein